MPRADATKARTVIYRVCLQSSEQNKSYKQGIMYLKVTSLYSPSESNRMYPELI